jgi:hypothetical protein
MKTAVVTSATSTAPTKKQTWTSTPLPASITILAFGAVCLLFSLHRRNKT